MAKRKLRIDDLYKIIEVSNPQISPDGKIVAYCYKYINKRNEYITRTYLAEADTGKIIYKLNKGKKCFSHKWSADGKYLNFISDASGTEQIWSFNKDSHEIKQITTMKNGVLEYELSPNMENIIFLSRVGREDTTNELVEESELKELEKARTRVRVIKDKFYKLDGIGFFGNSNIQIWLLNLKDNRYTQITDEECDHQYLSWSHSGEEFLYTKAIPQNRTDYHPLKSEMIIYDIKNQEPQCLIKGDISIVCPTFSPEDDMIAYFSHNIEYGEASFYKLSVFNRKNKENICLTPDIDMALGNWGLSDIGDFQIMSTPVWDCNESPKLYFTGSDKGNVEMYSVDLEKEFKKEIAGDLQIGQYSFDSKNKTFYYKYSTPIDPGEIRSFNLLTKNEKNISEVNMKLLKEVSISKPETFQVKTRDGHTIHGWAIKPKECNSEKKCPAILEIHGGPHLMYANTFFFEFQVLAAAGYTVFYSNPSGSMGYGQSFADANRGDYGGVDFDDLMEIANYIESTEYVDRDNIGITGGSYGGYMTNWIVTQTTRFKAAVTQRSISNLFTHAGVSDDGMFTAFLEQKVALDNLPSLYDRSPITYIDRVQTPLLIIHSENDLRCPLEQAEQMYINLKFRNRTTELIIYPNSSHGLSRSGYPPYRIDRLERILGWFNRFMGSTK